jgi:nitrogen regulatory protein PII
MKKVEAIIRSSKFKAVRNALKEVGVNFFTYRDVRGFGQQKSAHMVYRGTAYDIGYIARMQLEILVTEASLEKVIETIKESAKTGEIGDGKIVVLPVESVTRIRTNETDHEAIQ